MNLEDLEKLAELSKIEIPEEEKESLLRDLDAIVDYIGQIEKVEVGQSNQDFILKNVFREDENPHEGGVYSEDLIAEAPHYEDGFIKVKQII